MNPFVPTLIKNTKKIYMSLAKTSLFSSPIDNRKLVFRNYCSTYIYSICKNNVDNAGEKNGRKYVQWKAWKMTFPMCWKNFKFVMT